MLPPSHWLHFHLKSPHTPSHYSPLPPHANLNTLLFSSTTKINMIQTMNPYNATAKTAEIMSRYRPIAPKPEAPLTPNNTTMSENDQNSILPHNIRKSPYLRNVWAHLQARPTRTRKRGRTAAFAPPTVKRTRTCLQGLAPAYQPPAKNLVAMHGFSQYPSNFLHKISLVPINCGLDTAVTTLAESVSALPLIQSAAKGLDLNMEVADVPPKELDFMAKLKEPVKPSVISPRPIRPIVSKIVIEAITDIISGCEPRRKAAEQVEEEVEAETVPVIVSDSANRVRLTNSAYKEMVGQPECCWLDCIEAKACGGACRRIGGEVVLQFGDQKVEVMSMHGFNCSGKIEWESDGKKSCVNVTCEGVKLACEAKDYQFMWRFDVINQESESA